MRVWMFACLVACTGGKTTKDTAPTGSGSEMAQKMPGHESKPNWVQGVPLTPAADLIAWFESQKRNGEPRMTRIPVVMKKGQVGFTNIGAKIGTAADAVVVNLSDAALGIGIKDRARKCSGDTCPFIVEGFWRGKEGDSYTYEIRKTSTSPATAEELAAFTHAEVEGESGN